jgi:hypothetical protein
MIILVSQHIRQRVTQQRPITQLQMNSERLDPGGNRVERAQIGCALGHLAPPTGRRLTAGKGRA